MSDEVLKVIGMGSFGKVYQVERKNEPGPTYAMKVISKRKLVESSYNALYM